MVLPPPVAGVGFRPEIQALRAAAVLLVVGFHLWPDRLRGGFAGVDVFFVISGFLITGHLARELAQGGTIRLPAFYARRARRLLPAALTVLLAAAVGVFALLPMTVWPRTWHEILASALYFENWSLAGDSVDYFAAEDPPTLVQHFWSLSVEEQFYLAWPLLLLLAGAFSRWIPARLAPRPMRRLGGRRRVLPAAVAGLGLVLSFGWSALPHGSGAEYFSTFARAWEFAAGGLLALVVDARAAGRCTGQQDSPPDPGRGKPSPRGESGPPVPAVASGQWWTTSLSWVGWAAVLGSGLLLTEALRFPGWVAVFPVLGTVAVIAAGSPSGRFGTDRLIRSRPVQFTGGISYSLYLWHWPVIILFGRGPGGLENNGTSRFFLLAICVLLAVASTYLIEAPLRRSARPRRGRTGWTLGFAAAGMAAITLIAVIGMQRVESVQAQAEQQIEAVRLNPPNCFGAAALDPLRPGCDRPAPARPIPVPNPVAAFDDKPDTCMQAIDRAKLKLCSTGPAASDATRQVAVIADSHGMALMPALQQVARERGWRLIALLKGSCPLTTAVRVMDPKDAASCVRWNREVQTWLAGHPGIDEVIVTASSKNEFVPAAGLNGPQTAAQGYRQAWAELPARIRRIVVIRDVPRPRPDVVDCASAALNSGRPVRECGLPAKQALLDDPAAQAALTSGRAPQLIDLSQYFCRNDYCSPEIGGAFVYRDGHHLTATFSRTLAPLLGAALQP